MSGHNKWSKIKRKKEAGDAKKGQVFSKLVRLITMEAKKCGGDANAPALRAAVEKARAEIKAARDAVTAQAAKVYTVSFVSENELKVAFKSVKEQLHTDLTGLRDGAVKNARKAVQDTFQALRQVPNVDVEN